MSKKITKLQLEDLKKLKEGLLTLEDRENTIINTIQILIDLDYTGPFYRKLLVEQGIYSLQKDSYNFDKITSIVNNAAIFYENQLTVS